MIIGIYGHQDAGKTQLVEQLVRELVKRRHSVASIKHTPHKKTIDCEGKDTWRHWKAGSDPVAFTSESETSVIKHSKMPIERITGMLQREFEPDVIIIEGFKEGQFPKVAVGDVPVRRGTVMVNPKLKSLVEFIEREIATERRLKDLPGLNCGKCGLDCVGMARAITEGDRNLKDCVELPSVGVEISIGGKRIPAGRFVSAIVNDTVRGMVMSLKGYEPGKSVEIRLSPNTRATRKRKNR